MEKDFYKGGVILVIVGFLIGVYNFYLLHYSIALFLIGIILIWFLGHSLLYKFLFTFTPIILYIPCTAVFLHLYNYAPTKLILAPVDHVGKFRIIYDEPCGHAYELNKDMKTVKINDAGIAIMREKSDGNRNFKYQFSGVDSAYIPVILDVADTARYDVAILAGSAGVHYVSTSLDEDNTSDIDFRYSDFYVYRKGNGANWSDEPIDSLTRLSIQKCRNQFKRSNEH